MKVKCVLLLALMVSLAGACFGQVELVGYMALREDSRFVLKEAPDGQTSEWIRLGSTFAGFKLVSYDHDKEILTVERSGARFELRLKASRVASAPAPTPHPTPKEFTLGTVRFTFENGGPLDEQAIRQMMILRPGAVFDKRSLDRDVRALYRSGYFSAIEVKHDQAAPDVLNLEVILTRKS